jgi:mannose-6-phosphate isomerase-like protein (cupin superfamily)
MTAPAPASAATPAPSGYQHSPRPSYDHGIAIPRSQAARHVWGDAESGEILDLVYVSNDRIHQLLFEIPAGGQFTHSPDFRTIFGADEVMYVVDGCVALADPQNGSVTRIEAGEAAFFGPDTWHHAFNWGPGPARILEYFAPPPATGTSGAYAQRQPYLSASRYTDDSVLGTVIPGQPTTEPPRLAVIRPDAYAWRLDGDRDRVLTGIIASTPHLTAARCEVRGPRWSGWISHPGDAGGYVLSGGLALWLADRGRGWDELRPGDGFFVPAGERYQVRGLDGGASYLTGYAPTGRPTAGPEKPESITRVGSPAQPPPTGPDPTRPDTAPLTPEPREA